MTLAVATCIATGQLIDRYRDGDAEVRRQLRWIVLDGAMAVIAVTPLLLGRYLAYPGEAVGELLVVAATLGAATYPLVVAMAITRADLFDVDLIIGRTLVYVPLTAALAGLYAATVALLQRVFMLLTGESSDFVMLLSTLLLAAAFTPVRAALDGFVERHFRTQVRAATGAATHPGAPETAGVTEAAHDPMTQATMSSHASRLSMLEARVRELEAALVLQHPVTHSPD